MNVEPPVENEEVNGPPILRQLFHGERIEPLLAEAARKGVRVNLESGAALLAALMSSGFVLMLVGGFIAGEVNGTTLVGLTLFLFSSFVVAGLALSDLWTEGARLLDRIATHNDVMSVGPLAEALLWRNPPLQRAATTALIRLLPHLRASDVNLLNNHQRKCLYSALHGANVDLTLALLRGLEQSGDHRALPHVEALASRAGETTRRDGRIQEAAQACLPYLRIQAERARISQSLLRPSSIAELPTGDLVHPADPPDRDLLRPAQGSGETEPHLLLRPQK
jgi:hypothetical protein